MSKINFTKILVIVYSFWFLFNIVFITIRFYKSIQ